LLLKKFIFQVDLQAMKSAKRLSFCSGMTITFNVSLETICLISDLWLASADEMGGLSGLVVEICEQQPDCYLAHSEFVQKIMIFAKNVRLRGGLVALDDFGDGFLSGETLLCIFPDVLKINLEHILQRGDAWFSVERYARQKSVLLVVERIETVAELIFVKSISLATHIQGFIYNKQPMLVGS
jgi:EAL domain-containing protein (putative c-di-GMP-specific phosphodiesterase class I)